MSCSAITSSRRISGAPSISFREQEKGARILLKKVTDAERFGVAEFDGDRGDHIVGIEEKPAHPKSNYAVTGIYMYDATAFEKIHTCKPSGRNELEITDVNNAYIKEGTMTFSFLEGWWTETRARSNRSCGPPALVAQSRQENAGSGAAVQA